MTDRRGETMIVKYCPIHLSTFLDVKDERCAWDRHQGPRPGRGACEKHEATIIVGYGVKVWPFGAAVGETDKA